MCVPHILYQFICQWMCRLLPVLAVVNSAAINIGVCVSFQIRFFSIHAQEWDWWIRW